MRIGIDLTRLTPGASGGIVPLLEGVVRETVAQSAGHTLTIFRAEQGLAVDVTGRDNVDVVTLPSQTCEPEVDRQAVQRSCQALFRAFPCIHRSSYPMSRQIVLIPDLQHEIHPEFFTPEVLHARRRNFNYALAEAGAIGTISDHALRSLRAHPATRCTDFFIMSPALTAGPAPSTLADLTDFERAVLPARDFFLYPANLWPHKNHRRVLQAFAEFLRREQRPVEFILTGDPNGWAPLGQEFATLPVRHLGYVRRVFLQVLMQRCRALAFFSLFEGFGMPLLEAFHAGAPVICSNTTSLPEVGGDAVLSCDPTDAAAMSGCMQAILDEAPLRDRLIARGKLRLAAYSWETSARNLWAACARVADGALAPIMPIQAAAPRPMTLGRIVRGVAKRVRHGLVLARRRARAVVNLAVPARVRARLSSALQPRLGLLHMYPPRPLALPSHYTAVRPPQPAPTMAIVTPSFNQAGFLERTIRSVLDQEYPRLEYVVQDGGSWDQTSGVLDRYRDRLTHVESCKDRGQAHAINLGFRRTTGEIMAYLNSDDVLLPGTLAYVARYFACHPKVDVVYGHRIIIDEHDQEVGRWLLPPHEDRAILWVDYVPQETLFWRRRIWDKAGGAMDESFQFALDWDLLLRFRAAGARFKRLPRFLGAFRVHHQQKTSVSLASVGVRETDRLVLKVHGRIISDEERTRRSRSFLHKHVVLDRLHRWGWLSA